MNPHDSAVSSCTKSHIFNEHIGSERVKSRNRELYFYLSLYAQYVFLRMLQSRNYTKRTETVLSSILKHSNNATLVAMLNAASIYMADNSGIHKQFLIKLYLM